MGRRAPAAGRIACHQDTVTAGSPRVESQRVLQRGMLRRSVMAATVGALFGAGCLSTRGPSVPKGKAAPPFSLKSHDGRDVSLDDLVAKGPVAVVFYRGFW